MRMSQPKQAPRLKNQPYQQKATVMKKNIIIACYLLIFISVQLFCALSDGTATESSGFVYSEWQFGRADGSVIANRIRLLPGGKIDGYYHPNEDHWGVERGVLVFYHKSGKPSCRFSSSRTENGRLVLRGPFLFNKTITHVLRSDK